MDPDRLQRCLDEMADPKRQARVAEAPPPPPAAVALLRAVSCPIFRRREQSEDAA